MNKIKKTNPEVSKYFNQARNRFVQINGTAMGMIFARTYAMLSMGYFELTFYRICGNEFGETLGQFMLENWCQFLDDCETPLDKTKINPNRLLEIFNSINLSIKFTMERSDKELPFLSNLVKRNDSKIWIDIYFKSIFIHWCLPFS